MSDQLFPKSDEFEIPAFLRRQKPQPQGELPVTQQAETPTPAAADKKRRKMKDAYVVRATITIPVDLANPQAFADAATAIGKIPGVLPAGATFESEARIGKIEAA